MLSPSTFCIIEMNYTRIFLICNFISYGKKNPPQRGHNETFHFQHTDKTVDLPGECRNADIIVACCGVAKTIGADHLREGQIVIDVGMNVDENGNLCGDVDYDKASEIAEAVTPVPGGVGSVTTSVLLKHVVDSCAGA